MNWLDRKKSKPGCTYELHDGRPGGYSWHDVIDTVTQLRQGKSMIVIRVPLFGAKLFFMAQSNSRSSDRVRTHAHTRKSKGIKPLQLGLR